MYNIPVCDVKPTPATCLTLFLAAMAGAAPAAAFYPATHADIVSRAVSGICEKGPDKPLCAVLRENLPFLQFGARLEDSGYEGFTEVHNGELFYDEEFSDWAGSILSLHPAVKRELALAGEISVRIKPAVVSSTEKLFEIFWARAGLVSAGIEPPPVRATGASQVSMPDFDGRRPAP